VENAYQHTNIYLSKEKREITRPVQLEVLPDQTPRERPSPPGPYGRCRELRTATFTWSAAGFRRTPPEPAPGPLLPPAGERRIAALRNDLQSVVSRAASVRQAGPPAQADGALGVAMSGSGPSLFALFADRGAEAPRPSCRRRQA